MNRLCSILILVFLLSFPDGQAYPQTTWYKYPGNPVLEAGKHGEWDERILDASVIKVDSGYHLWYNANLMDQNDLGGLGYAWSKDGLHFQKYEGNPLRLKGGEDTWGKLFATFDVIRSDSGFILYFSGNIKGSEFLPALGMAWSKDGIAWERYPDPILTKGQKDSWDGHGIADPGVVYDGKKYHMLYNAMPYKIPKVVLASYASSSDGINWEKYTGNPVLDIGEPGDFDDRWVIAGDLVYSEASFELWYIGWNYIQFEGGLATSTDCIHWQKSPSNPILQQGRLGDWDSNKAGPIQIIHTDISDIMFYWGDNNISSGIGYATTSAREKTKWEKDEITPKQKNVRVNIFNREEIINLDSLTALFEEIEGIALVDVLNKLALAYALNDESKSFAYANDALKLAGELKYARGRAMALYSIGNSQYLNDRYADAMANQLRALWIMDSLGMKRDAAYLMLQIAGIHSYAGSNEHAIGYLRQALKNFNELQDSTAMVLTLDYLGNEYIRAADTAEAISIYRKKLAYSLALNSPDDIGNAYDGLGVCYSGKELDSAMFYFATGLEYRMHGKWVLLAETYLKMAEIYLRSGPEYIDNAEENYMKAYDAALMTLGEGIIQLSVCEGLAMLYLEKRQWPECLEYLNLASDVCRVYLSKQTHQIYPSLNNMIEYNMLLKQHMESIHRLYFRYYSGFGDSDLALDHFMLATAWKDSLANEQSWKKVAMIQGDYESARSRNMITILENQNEMANLEVRQTRFYLFTLAGFVFVLFLLGFLLIRQNRIRAEHRNVLLEQKLFRLQMNPHFIFNALSSILNFISRKELDNASNYLTSFSHLLRSTLQGSREEYIPLDEEIVNLRNYLDLQSIRYINTFDYDINVDEQIDEDVIIPPMLIQPFVENAVEHGIKHLKEKGHITIRFKKEDKLLLCEVEDNGVGRQRSSEINFSVRTGHKSLATEIILDRINTINKKSKLRSTLSIEDLHNNGTPCGTRIILQLPYLTDS